jgi:ketosteroid isomerase-like protein
MEPIETVRQYVGRINASDTAGLAGLVTEDHRFVDAEGTTHQRGLTREGWAGYFEIFPDYQIVVETIFANGETVAAFGHASGSFQGKGAETPALAWRFAAAWKAVVRGGKIFEWRVYADVEPMMRSMGARRFS